VFALVGLLGFIGIKWALTRQTQHDLNGYSNLVQLAPEVAHITITLP
jgi:type VI secretion system protein ImpK